MAEVGDVEMLTDSLPAGSGQLVSFWLDKHPVKIRLSKARQTKLGDFRPPHKELPARISINIDLHPVEFLITLAHELAHAEIWQLNGRRVKPHGKEWKNAFREKLKQIIDTGILEEKFEIAIQACYFRSNKLATSSCPDLRLLFDDEKHGSKVIRLDDIPRGSKFVTTNGKTFIKGNKLRTRYKCREAKTFRIYTVHSMTEIVEFKTPKL